MVQIENLLPSAARVLPVHGILDPPSGNKYTAQELGGRYVQANIFGRCVIHRTVMEMEIAQKLLERKERLHTEIIAHEKSKADAVARTEIAKKMFKENEALVFKSLVLNKSSLI